MNGYLLLSSEAVPVTCFYPPCKDYFNELSIQKLLKYIFRVYVFVLRCLSRHS